MNPENDKARRASDDINVFQTVCEGAVVWRGSFATREAAEARINELLVSEPGEYFTHNQSTGNKNFFKPNGHNGTR